MKINSLIYLLCIFCFPQMASGQEVTAKSVLDRTVALFKKGGGVEISFSVVLPEEEQQGSIRLKGEKFLLKTEDMVTWFDGRTQWSYLVSADEVTVSEPLEEELQGINPYAWLSLYENGYDLKLQKQQGKQANTVNEVVMTAAQRGRELQRVTIYIDKVSSRPLKFFVLFKGNDAETAVLIDSFHTGRQFDDSLFVFDRKSFPSAEVIDLR